MIESYHTEVIVELPILNSFRGGRLWKPGGFRLALVTVTKHTHTVVFPGPKTFFLALLFILLLTLNSTVHACTVRSICWPKNIFFKIAFPARFIGQFLKIDFLVEHTTPKPQK